VSNETAGRVYKRLGFVEHMPLVVPLIVALLLGMYFLSVLHLPWYDDRHPPR